MKKKFFIILILLTLFCKKDKPKEYQLAKTSEGILKKVVVKKNNTTLYSPKNKKLLKYVDQWEVFYVIDLSLSDYLGVTPNMNNPDEHFLISKNDAIEWNSFFTINSKNNPTRVNRQVFKIYETLEGCKSKNEENIIAEEHPLSGGRFEKRSDVIIVLEDLGNSYYKIAFPSSTKSGKLANDFGEGYLKYDSSIFEIRRFVSRKQLEDQINSIKNANRLLNLKKFEKINEVFNSLSYLLANFKKEEKRGINDIVNIFKGKYVPQFAKEKLFEPGFIEGKDLSKLSKNTKELQMKMSDYLDNKSIWDSNGRAFVPKEW